MKTKEELKEIREEVESITAKLCELTEEELAQVTGGTNDEALKNDSTDWIVKIIQLFLPTTKP